MQLYFLRLGFLDGVPGFQICVHTAYNAFLKQAILWEMHNANVQPDPEAEVSDEIGEPSILAFSPKKTASDESDTKQKQRRMAA